MDLATILAVAVAALIIFSGYFLFNGLPAPKRGADTRRSARRT